MCTLCSYIFERLEIIILQKDLIIYDLHVLFQESSPYLLFSVSIIQLVLSPIHFGISPAPSSLIPDKLIGDRGGKFGDHSLPPLLWLCF